VLTLVLIGEASILITAKGNCMVHLLNANAVHPMLQINRLAPQAPERALQCYLGRITIKIIIIGIQQIPKRY
jgi:hypothetical protein